MEKYQGGENIWYWLIETGHKMVIQIVMPIDRDCTQWCSVGYIIFHIINKNKVVNLLQPRETQIVFVWYKNQFINTNSKKPLVFSLKL